MSRAMSRTTSTAGVRSLGWLTRAVRSLARPQLLEPSWASASPRDHRGFSMTLLVRGIRFDRFMHLWGSEVGKRNRADCYYLQRM